ncbi:hypothetical protein [Paenibacillus antarcticus]|uniref:hypothetical protein n=1 Tax=Paenibacillus antarcticus TaxID=253703 RepID=UPI0011F29E63|nr:hypothetical protein [Paenibacillus antarcticus]
MLKLRVVTFYGEIKLGIYGWKTIVRLSAVKSCGKLATVKSHWIQFFIDIVGTNGDLSLHPTRKGHVEIE